MEFLNKLNRTKEQKNFHERCMSNVNVVDMFPRRTGKSVALAMLAFALARERKMNILIYHYEPSYMRSLLLELFEWSKYDPKKIYDWMTFMFDENVDKSKITFDNGSVIYLTSEKTVEEECSEPDLFLFEYFTEIDLPRLTQVLIPKMASSGVPMKGVGTGIWTSEVEFDTHQYFFRDFDVPESSQLSNNYDKIRKKLLVDAIMSN